MKKMIRRSTKEESESKRKICKKNKMKQNGRVIKKEENDETEMKEKKK